MDQRLTLLQQIQKKKNRKSYFNIYFYFYICYITLIIMSFFISAVNGDFHSNSSETKSAQLSRTLLSILADLSSTVNWTVSIFQISSSPSFISRVFAIVPMTLIMIGITVIFM